MKRLTLVLSLILVALPAFPSWLSVGVKGGIPLTDAFEAASNADLHYVTNTKRYTVGPVVEVRLPLGLGVEFDALYKRLDYEARQSTVSTATTANSWEFPVLLKARVPSEVVRPYVVAGPSFRHLSNIRQVAGSVFTGQFSEVTPRELQNRFAAGFAVGGGIEFGNRFRVAPEVRYTRWGWENFQLLPGRSELRSNLNQVDFLLGLHF